MVAERSEATHASLVDRDIRYFVVVGRWSGADPSLSGDGFVGRRSVECAEARRPCSASAKTDYGIPAQAAQQTGARGQLIVTLRVHTNEAAAIAEVDGAFRGHRVGGWHLVSAVEQQSLAIAQAVGIRPSHQEIDA